MVPPNKEDASSKQQEFVLRTLEERDIRFVRLWFTDVLGFLKSVAIAASALMVLQSKDLHEAPRLTCWPSRIHQLFRYFRGEQ
jgi:glutamine synthetase